MNSFVLTYWPHLTICVVAFEYLCRIASQYRSPQLRALLIAPAAVWMMIAWPVVALHYWGWL